MAAQRQCSTPFELVDFVQQHLRNGYGSRDQDLAELVRHINQDLRPAIESASGNTEPDLSHLVELFDRIFFGGRLNGRVEIAWDGDLFDMDKAIALTESLGDEDARILIYPHPGRDGLQVAIFGTRMADSIVSTVLHECIHAYVMVCGCFEGACGKSACSNAWWDDVGEDGHGNAWQCMAKVVEDYVSENGLWGCDVGRVDAAQAHFTKTEEMLSADTLAFCWPDDVVKPDKSTDGWELVWCLKADMEGEDE